MGIPLESARETMRPLPLSPLRDGPPFVLGLSLVRGVSVPVVDLGALLGRGEQEEPFRRFVTLEVDGRGVALAVESVENVVTLKTSDFTALPPLFSRAAGEAVEALALHDSALLLVLRASRLVPDAPLDAQGAAP